MKKYKKLKNSSRNVRISPRIVSLKGGNTVADDSNRDGINPLFGIAGQIMGEFGVPDQIELTTTVDGEPVQMDLVYEGDNGEYGQSADRGSGLTGRAFSLSSAKLDDRTGSKYVFERDRGPGTIH